MKSTWFFETYSLHRHEHPCSSVGLQGNLPSRQIVPSPCPVLSITHGSSVLDARSCGKAALCVGTVWHLCPQRAGAEYWDTQNAPFQMARQKAT